MMPPRAYIEGQRRISRLFQGNCHSERSEESDAEERVSVTSIGRDTAGDPVAIVSPLPHRRGHPKNFLEFGFLYDGGDGRTRTAVQTPHQAAFYTFSLSLVVGWQMPEDRPVPAYPLSLGRV